MMHAVEHVAPHRLSLRSFFRDTRGKPKTRQETEERRLTFSHSRSTSQRPSYTEQNSNKSQPSKERRALCCKRLNNEHSRRAWT